MKRGSSRKGTRIPHPDPRTELRLQEIAGRQEAIARQAQLIAEYQAQMSDGREHQNGASRKFRWWSWDYNKDNNFSRDMEAQRQRISDAAGGIATAEAFITAQRAEITRLAAELSETDLAFL